MIPHIGLRIVSRHIDSPRESGYDSENGGGAGSFLENDGWEIMASLFECEVRYIIEDIAAFKRRLEELGAELLYPYEFTDHYYRPREGEWNLSERNLRIRHWTTPREPTTVFFVKTEIVTIGELQFKRALYSQGKVPLFSGGLEECRSLLDDLGFEPWFDVAKKDAALWDVPKHGFKTVTEFIEGLGWTGELEFEGKNPQQAAANIESALKALRIPKELVTFRPISQIFAEKTGIV